MGFNISGIVINKNFEKNINELSKILNLNLEFDKEIDFETASENWKDEGIIDVYFGNNGTLIFANEDLCLGNGYSFSGTNILTFALSETSMAFNFGYTENGNNIRSKMEVNGEIIDENGNKLEIENDEEDISEIIWKLISEILGISFESIETNEKAFRFSIKEPSYINSENQIQEVENDKFDFSNLFNRYDLKTKYTKDELVKLFNKMIKYAQENSINIFYQPICYKDSTNIFMANLVYLKDAISEHNDLIDLFNSKIPMNSFSAIGRAYENQIDEDTNIRMLQMIKVMKPIQQNENNKNIKENKSWWQFWK